MSIDVPASPRHAFERGRLIWARGFARTIAGIALPLIALLVTGILRAAEITVFAAVSLKDALTEISAAYSQESGEQVHFSFGASNILARQIEEGAPADLFFSADEAKMDALEKNGILMPGTRSSLLSNTLVVVVAADSTAPAPKSIGDLAKPEISKLALAETQSVPAGIYAREYLEKLKLWTSLKEKVVPTENVRSALAAVESGNVEAGIVYKTDALISKKIRIVIEVPAAAGPKISYPVAVLKDAKQPIKAKAFAMHLATPAAKTIFEKFGFLVQEPISQ